MSDGTHNDGGLIFGSQVITIPLGMGGKAFIAKNIKLSKPMKLIESMDQFGQPNKEVMVPQNLTGTMSLTIIDVDTLAPAFGAHFQLTPHGSTATAIDFKVAEADEAWDQNGEGTFDVTFRKYLHVPS